MRRPLDSTRTLQRHHALTGLNRFNRLERAIAHDDARADRDTKVLSLVLLRVLSTLKRSKAHTTAMLQREQLFLLAVVRAERHVDFLRALDQVVLLRHLFAEEHRIEVLAVALALERVLAEHTVCLASTSGTAEEDFSERAIDQQLLTARLWRPRQAHTGDDDFFAGAQG